MAMMKLIIKKILLRFSNIGKKVIVGKKCNIGFATKFEGANKINDNTTFEGFIGYGSYIGLNCDISAHIKRYCSIGNNVHVLTGTHPLKKFVSTNPVFYSLGKQNGINFVNRQKFNEKLYADESNKCGVIIGNDVWIGYGVTIIGGVTIGDGAVVLAGAVVTKDISPYSIVGGIPAKEISKRFDEETVKFLIEFSWWEKPVEWIKENVELFDDIEKFKKMFGGK